MVGGLVGNYRIVRKLGEGGMGTVYVGEHALLGRQAAVKVLQAALSARPDIVDRFFNEAKATTAIHDAGIVQIFDFGYHVDGSAYIVMELLEGEPLDRRLSRLGRLPVVDSLRIIRQLAKSLGAAHARGIVHRDLKPENVFLSPDSEVPGGERAKILDFGIAKLGDEDAERVKTRTGAIMGTPVYMSPEQCRGAGEVDHRADVYALGCVLFHLLCGRPPFRGPGAGDIISAHMRDAPPVPSRFLSGLPRDIDAIVLRCMAKSPDDRYESMAELAIAIEQLGYTTDPSSMLAHGSSGGTRVKVSTDGPTLDTSPPGETVLPRSPPTMADAATVPGRLQFVAADGSGSESLEVEMVVEMAPTPTTLGLSTGQTSPTQAGGRRRLWLGAALLASAVAGAAVWLLFVREPALSPGPSGPSDPSGVSDSVEPAAGKAVPPLPTNTGAAVPPALAEPALPPAIEEPAAAAAALPDAGVAEVEAATDAPDSHDGNGRRRKRIVKRREPHVEAQTAPPAPQIHVIDTDEDGIPDERVLQKKP
jgi:serine/threonine protein kinase